MPHPAHEAARAEPAPAADHPDRPTRRPAVAPGRLTDPLPDLPEAEAPGFAALRADWHARLMPIDEAERAAADAMAVVAWRRRRLDAVDEQVLRALARGAPAPGLPSLATLCRYRARLARDLEEVERELRRLWSLRPQPPALPSLGPERLEWLAARLRADARRPAPRQTAPEPVPAAGATRPAAEAPAAAPGAPPRPTAAPTPVPAEAAAPAALARHVAPERPGGWRGSASPRAIAVGLAASGGRGGPHMPPG